MGKEGDEGEKDIGLMGTGGKSESKFHGNEINAVSGST